MHHPDVNTLTLDIISKFNELNRWCISNKLTINASTTNFILFHTLNKPIPHNFVEITTEVMDIRRVTSFKYLGITLDKTLNWSEHVTILCKSLLKCFAIFNHIEYKVTPKVKFIMPLSILVFNMELKFIVVVRKHTQIDCKLYKINVQSLFLN